jgi:hypothetical protein
MHCIIAMTAHRSISTVYTGFGMRQQTITNKPTIQQTNNPTNQQSNKPTNQQTITALA